MTLAVPNDACDMTTGRGQEGEGQRVRQAAKIAFDRGQDAALGIVVIESEEVPGRAAMMLPPLR